MARRRRPRSAPARCQRPSFGDDRPLLKGGYGRLTRSSVRLHWKPDATDGRCVCWTALLACYQSLTKQDVYDGDRL